MATTEQGGSVLLTSRTPRGNVESNSEMNEMAASAQSMAKAIEATHLDTLQVDSTAATFATEDNARLDGSALPPRLRRKWQKNATESREQSAATTEPVDGEEGQMNHADADIDNAGLPPKFRRAWSNLAPHPPAAPEHATRNQTAAHIEIDANADANIDNIDNAGLPVRFRRAWRNVAPIDSEPTTGDPTPARFNPEEDNAGLPVKFRRAWRNLPPPPPIALEPATGDATLAHVNPDDDEGSQAGPPSPQAGPVLMVPSSAYLRKVVDTLREHGILPEATAPAPVVADDDDEEEEEEEEEEEPVHPEKLTEKKVSFRELCGVGKPSRRVVRKDIPVQRVLRSAAKGKQSEEQPVVVNPIDANENNGKGKNKAVTEGRPAVNGDSSKAKAPPKIVEKGKGREQPPVVVEEIETTKNNGKGKKEVVVEESPAVDSESSDEEEQPKIVTKTGKGKAKASKYTKEAVKVAVRAAKNVAQAKTVEHTLSTRRRKETVKATIRAKKVIQAKVVERKASTRRRGAAKAAITGSTAITKRVSLIVLPPKRTRKVKITVGERPPLSGTTHNTPSKSSAPKVDEGAESISSRPRLTIRLPAMKAVEKNDDVAGEKTKENSSVAETFSAKKVEEKAPRRTTRNAEKLEAPKTKEAESKPAAGRPKRKELHDDHPAERNGNKRTKKNDAKPVEDAPKVKIVLRVPRMPTREEIMDVKVAGAESEAAEESKGKRETIANDEFKLRRSSRPKKASFKKGQQ